MLAKDRNLIGFGEEITDYKFNGILDWLVKVNDPREIWKAQPTYLISEWTFITIGLLTFIHSQRVGGRFRWLWLTTVLHGLIVENVTFWTPVINNFWHSQTTIVLLGRRLPLHIICLYPTFIYTASVCVSRLRLGTLANALAVGLSVVLIDIPYDIMAVKFVHWTWHDTDPNIYDRHYWVPWTSYYFHATFAAAVTYAFHFWRRTLCQNDPENPWVSDKRVSRELLASVLTALCGMPGGVIQFLPLYHPLHDFFGIHTENCVITLFVIFFLIAWKNDRKPVVGSRPMGKSGWKINELVLALILHYSVYLGMALYGDPQHEVSVGLHEKIGPCNEMMELKTMFTLITGETAERRKFLCPTDYDEQYFDFRCLSGDNTPPKMGSEWYTICGTPFPNRAEYIQVLATICFLAFMLFKAMLFNSGDEWTTSPSVGKPKKKN
ncbi:uncharacterized protein LOC110856826 [Folsomia candida]|uniref:DUF7802 domain-containing protein n=1 Tax=Folsomia candida TaxID=158441 RepID=A0A226DL46_FOLCA|nr:uncharacterized protein LOC110856826 [Folsomia candida]OXA45718.1 hypothetical protein Fcan01_19455 [Folsomia candida]